MTTQTNNDDTTTTVDLTGLGEVVSSTEIQEEENENE